MVKCKSEKCFYSILSPININHCPGCGNEVLQLRGPVQDGQQVLPHKLLGLADTHTYLTQRLL